MKNNLKEMATAINGIDKVLLLPHVRPDGDAIGSSVALCLALRKMGKKAIVLTDGRVPENLKFLENDCLADEISELEEFQMAILMDCGELHRIGDRQAIYEKFSVTACIDHHSTSKGICNHNLIDPKEAATCQLVFKLIEELDVEIDKEIAEAIYAGILTDTGRFSYSNASSETFKIAGKLIEYGANGNYVYNEIYETVSKERMALKSMALNSMEFFADGKGAITFVSQEMLSKTGSVMSDSDGISEEMRTILGVEISALIKEHNNEEIKVSMRVKTNGNVAEIGEKFGGGGHIKAAGCTLNMPLEDAIETIKKEIELNLEKYGN